MEYNFSKGSSNSSKSATFIGSAIAESKPDIHAASYASAKHALKGLVTSIQAEQSNKSSFDFSIKLFSPGYMLTDMLPSNSAPRLENKAEKVESVASRLVQFIDSSDQMG